MLLPTRRRLAEPPSAANVSKAKCHASSKFSPNALCFESQTINFKDHHKLYVVPFHILQKTDQ